jgi:hypothetical protein
MLRRVFISSNSQMSVLTKVWLVVVPVVLHKLYRYLHHRPIHSPRIQYVFDAMQQNFVFVLKADKLSFCKQKHSLRPGSTGPPLTQDRPLQAVSTPWMRGNAVTVRWGIDQPLAAKSGPSNWYMYILYRPISSFNHSESFPQNDDTIMQRQHAGTHLKNSVHNI